MLFFLIFFMKFKHFDVPEQTDQSAVLQPLIIQLVHFINIWTLHVIFIPLNI